MENEQAQRTNVLSEQHVTVSVIIPTYNRAAWLPRSMKSVFDQTHTDWDLIVVDDRSTDQTKEYVTQLSQSDPRIRYVSNTRGKGVSGARNTGIDLASGKFIAFLDSDDEWTPNHLADSLAALSDPRLAVAAVSAHSEKRIWKTNSTYGGEDPSSDTLPPETQTQVLENQKVFDLFAAGQGPIEITALVIDRDALGAHRFQETLTMGEDGFLIMELLSAGISFAIIPHVHVTKWSHDSNVTAAGSRRQSCDEIVRMNEELEKLGQHVLSRFPLTEAQQTHIKSLMAESRFWQIGYRGQLKARRYREARDSFRLAQQWKRWNLNQHKTYWLTFIRQLLRV